MSLIRELQKLKDNLIRLPEELGMPQYRPVAIRKLHDSGLFYDELLTPTPKVGKVNNGDFGSSTTIELLSQGTIEITAKDFLLKHVSRVRYTYEFLSEKLEYYIVDYCVVWHGTQQILTGIRCKPLLVDDSGTTSYKVVLKRLADHLEILNTTELNIQ